MWLHAWLTSDRVQVGVTPLEVTREMRILHLSIEGPASLLTSEVTLDLPSGVVSGNCSSICLGVMYFFF